MKFTFDYKFVLVFTGDYINFMINTEPLYYLIELCAVSLFFKQSRNKVFKGITNGAKFQVRNGATRWDFSACEEVTQLKAELKAKEEELKTLAKSRVKNLVNADTGEVYQLPIQKKGKDTLTLKFL